MPKQQYRPYMEHAIWLAKKALKSSFPNPCVGAVITTKDGLIIAEGYHKGAGFPHAEVEAIRQAQECGTDLSDCTLFVTLEPCNHYGKTPPCTKAILEAGIPHVVVGVLDPNTTAAGGALFLQNNGVRVETGVCEQECTDLIHDFIIWQQTPYPYTIIKLASTLDGRIATRTRHSEWISSDTSRKNVQELRRQVQAVIVGGNTFYADNPSLNCRNFETGEPDAQQPLAVVVTSRLPEAGANYKLLRERPEQTIFWTTISMAASPKAEALRKIGVQVLGMPPLPKGEAMLSSIRAAFDLSKGFEALRTEFQCYYCLCEGGGKLALSLLEKKLAHEVQLYFAPKILGDNEAFPLFDGRSPDLITDALNLRIIDSKMSGPDVLLTLKPNDNENLAENGD